MEIKNINLIGDKSVQEALERGALAHKRFARIYFKVKSVSDEKVEVQVWQDKNPNGNYATRQRLVEVGHELFGKHFNDRKLYIYATPYSPPLIDTVTPEWIDNKIRELRLKGRDVARDLDIAPSELSAYIGEHRQLSKRARAMFYY